MTTTDVPEIKDDGLIYTWRVNALTENLNVQASGIAVRGHKGAFYEGGKVGNAHYDGVEERDNNQLVGIYVPKGLEQP